MRKVIFLLTFYLTCLLLIDDADAAEHYVDTSIMFPDLPTQADVENPDSELYGLDIGSHYCIFYDHTYDYITLFMYDDEDITMQRIWYGGYQWAFNASPMILDQDNMKWIRHPTDSNINIQQFDSSGNELHSVMYNEVDMYINDELVFQQTLLKEPLSLVVQRNNLREGMLTSVLGSVISLIPLVLSVVLLFLGLRKALILLRMLLIRS